jgi:hypothetical protein
MHRILNAHCAIIAIDQTFIIHGTEKDVRLQERECDSERYLNPIRTLKLLVCSTYSTRLHNEPHSFPLPIEPAQTHD